MTATADTQFHDCCQAFAESYEISNLPAMRAIERSVLGCDYGGTSWTTIAQAEQIVELLDLRPGLHVLDIGAGSGWPGVYLADNSGCYVTLLDLPKNALVKALQRACKDAIADRVTAVTGSGAALPFKDRSVTAITHSDVLCCLPEKVEVLKECRRIATAGGSMLFSVIAVAPKLSACDYSRVIEAGPPFIEAPNDYADLLAQCGWQLEERIDVTSEHKESLAALVRALETSAALSEVLGEDVVSQSRKHRQEQISVIDDDLMIREIFLATAT